jgi:hypothetical protein
MPAGTSFGSDAGTQGRQLEPQRILPPQRTPGLQRPHPVAERFRAGQRWLKLPEARCPRAVFGDCSCVPVAVSLNCDMLPSTGQTLRIPGRATNATGAGTQRPDGAEFVDRAEVKFEVEAVLARGPATRRSIKHHQPADPLQPAPVVRTDGAANRRPQWRSARSARSAVTEAGRHMRVGSTPARPALRAPGAPARSSPGTVPQLLDGFAKHQ